MHGYVAQVNGILFLATHRSYLNGTIDITTGLLFHGQALTPWSDSRSMVRLSLHGQALTPWSGPRSMVRPTLYGQAHAP